MTDSVGMGEPFSFVDTSEYPFAYLNPSLVKPYFRDSKTFVGCRIVKSIGVFCRKCSILSLRIFHFMSLLCINSTSLNSFFN